MASTRGRFAINANIRKFIYKSICQTHKVTWNAYGISEEQMFAWAEAWLTLGINCTALKFAIQMQVRDVEILDDDSIIVFRNTTESLALRTRYKDHIKEFIHDCESPQKAISWEMLHRIHEDNHIIALIAYMHDVEIEFEVFAKLGGELSDDSFIKSDDLHDAESQQTATIVEAPIEAIYPTSNFQSQDASYSFKVELEKLVKACQILGITSEDLINAKKVFNKACDKPNFSKVRSTWDNVEELVNNRVRDNSSPEKEAAKEVFNKNKWYGYHRDLIRALEKAEKKALAETFVLIPNGTLPLEVMIEQNQPIINKVDRYKALILALVIGAILLVTALAITTIVLSLMSGVGVPAGVAAVSTLVGVAAHVGFVAGATSLGSAIAIGFTALAAPIVLYLYTAAMLGLHYFCRNKSAAQAMPAPAAANVVTQNPNAPITAHQAVIMPNNRPNKLGRSKSSLSLTSVHATLLHDKTGKNTADEKAEDVAPSIRPRSYTF